MRNFAAFLHLVVGILASEAALHPIDAEDANWDAETAYLSSFDYCPIDGYEII